MTDLTKIQQLKDKVENLQKKADRASGALDQIMEQLRKEFKVNTIAEAEKLLAKLQREEEKESERLEKELEQFEKEYGEKLDET